LLDSLLQEINNARWVEYGSKCACDTKNLKASVTK